MAAFRILVLSAIFFNTIFVVYLADSVEASTDSDVKYTECTWQYVDRDASVKSEVYKCPLVGESPENTQCCDNMAKKCCILAHQKSFFEMSQTTAIIIGVAVIAVVAIITAIIIVCCCWERCPLYMICRSEPKPDYLARPEDVAAMSLMPDENDDNVRVYAPTRVTLLKT